MDPNAPAREHALEVVREFWIGFEAMNQRTKMSESSSVQTKIAADVNGCAPRIDQTVQNEPFRLDILPTLPSPKLDLEGETWAQQE